MAYGTPADPVGGTVITVAYAVANILNPIRWLRLMTGNADPPGSSYIVASTSTTGTQWQKVTTDLIADQAVTPDKLQANFNFLTQPTFLGNAIWNDNNLPLTTIVRTNIVNNFTQQPTFLGNPIAYYNGAGLMSIVALTLSGALTAASAAISGALSAASASVSGLLTVGSITGGSGSAGSLSVKGLVVGADGANVGLGGVTTTGPVNPASYAAGSTSSGVPSVLGLNVGASGIASAGAVNPSSYTGGSTSAGIPSFLGASVGASGMAIAGQINSSVGPGTPPMIIASDTQVANLNAFMLQGIQPTATPTGTRIPISDSSGLLDSWVSPSAGAVPAGMGCLWSNTIASIPAGWSRWTAMNGRIPVSAGTTFSTTFVEGTSYGTSWSHTHTQTSHSHGASALGVSGNTGNNSAVGSRGGTGTNTADSPHTHDQGTLDVTGSTDSATPTITTDAWVIPMFAVVAVTKN